MIDEVAHIRSTPHQLLPSQASPLWMRTETMLRYFRFGYYSDNRNYFYLLNNRAKLKYLTLAVLLGPRVVGPLTRFLKIAEISSKVTRHLAVAG